jgi:DNA repair exonuclease SbcCD ATPase subunit
MKTILAAGIAGIILFAASASVSWYLMNQNGLPEETEVAQEVDSLEPGVPEIGPSDQKSDQMPVAIRPDIPLTVEAVLELSESIRKKERELIDREKRVNKAEENIKLLFEDLKIERDQITELVRRIESRLQQANTSVADLKVENQQLETKAQELKQLLQKNKPEVQVEVDEIAERVKTAKDWFKNLAEDQAANYLKTFANNGDLEFAARLLDSMDQRKAAKILGVLDDAEFVDQMLKVLSVESRNDISDRAGLRNLR